MNKIRFYRKQIGISQKCLSEAIGVSQQAVAKWEIGQNDPRSDKLPLLATVLHCTVDELFSAGPAPAADSEKSA